MNTIAELNEQEIFVAITKQELEFLIEETDFFNSNEFLSDRVNHIGSLKYGDILFEMDKDCCELLKEILANSNHNPKREIFKKIEETLDEEEEYFKRFMKIRNDLIKKRTKSFDKLSESERKEIIAKMHAKLKDRDWHYAFIDKAMHALEEDPEGAKSVLYNEKTLVSPDEEDEEEIDNEAKEHDCEKCLFTSVCDKSKKSDKDVNDFDTEETAKEILRRLGVPKKNIHIIDLSEESEEECKERKHKELQEILDDLIKLGRESY